MAITMTVTRLMMTLIAVNMFGDVGGADRDNDDGDDDVDIADDNSDVCW